MPMKTMPKFWPEGKPWRDIHVSFSAKIDGYSLHKMKLPQMDVGDRLVMTNAAVMMHLRSIAHARPRERYESWHDADWINRKCYLGRIS